MECVMEGSIEERDTAGGRLNISCILRGSVDTTCNVSYLLGGKTTYVYISRKRERWLESEIKVKI